MVKVHIVEEKDQDAASPYASPSSSASASSASLDSLDDYDESFLDRLAALKDIVPPTTRHSIVSTVAKTASWLRRGGKLVGSVVWVVTTSALLVALPLALSLEDEAKIVAQEKEVIEQQQGAEQVSLFTALYSLTLLTCHQMLGPSPYNSAPNPNQPKPLVPPGF